MVKTPLQWTAALLAVILIYSLYYTCSLTPRQTKWGDVEKKSKLPRAQNSLKLDILRLCIENAGTI